MHVGEDCWDGCGQQSGYCPTFCGSLGVCCRIGWDDTPECVDVTGGHSSGHTCVAPAPSSPPPSPSQPPPPPTPPSPPHPPYQPALDFGGCDLELVKEPTFGSTANAGALVGKLEVGQTHVITAVGDNRIHEKLVAGRETVILFTPTTALQEDAWSLVLRAMDTNANTLGVLPLVAPSNPVALFEQRWTTVNLDDLGGEAERLAAWHTVLPAPWIAEGVKIQIGKVAKGGDGSPVDALLEYVLSDLSAPAKYTFHRLPVYLWGDSSEPMPAMKENSGDASKLTVDMFAVLPLKELRWVDIPPCDPRARTWQQLPAPRTRMSVHTCAAAPPSPILRAVRPQSWCRRTCCRLTHTLLWSVRAGSYVLNEFVVTGVNGTAKLVTSEEELRTTSTRECYQCAMR